MFFISFVSTFTKLVDLCMGMLVIGEKLFVFVKNSIVTGENAFANILTLQMLHDKIATY